MSEFYFDYKCMPMSSFSDEDKGDKALDFYLYQDYGGTDTDMCAQVYIPREMQKKFCGVRLYHTVNGVEVPDIGTLDNSRFIPMNPGVLKSAEYCVSSDNCVYIRGNGELSGSGVIAFIDGKDILALPKPENAYKYVINYSEKETISYRIIERKNKLTVQVIYPLIRSKIVLNVVRKRGAKPVLIQDCGNPENIVKKDREKVRIELEPNGRVKDAVKEEIDVDGANKNDFRLIFEDPENSRYYILVDESDNTLEDKEKRREEFRNRDNIVKSEKKCPYCGNPLKIDEKYKKGKTEIITCKGEHIEKAIVAGNLQGCRTIVCGEDLQTISNPAYDNIKGTINKRSKRADEGGMIPVNNLIIPEGYDKLPSMNITLVGMTMSGKTIFLASLYNMINGGADKGVYSDPFVLNEIVKKFDRKKGRAEEVKFLNLKVDDDSVQIGEDCEISRRSPRQLYKTRYTMSVGGDVESFTDPKELAKLDWHPIGFKMGNLGFIYFYDVPGEKFNQDSMDKIRSVGLADCLIAVIDGAKEGGASAALSELSAAMGRLKTSTSRAQDFKNMPIAIVFTKYDLRLKDYIPDDNPVSVGKCFDDNCHVVREDIISLLPKNGVYTGSDLERHIDCSSYEIEHFLKSASSESAQILNSIKNDFRNIKYFACSALGSNKCLNSATGDNRKEVLFKPRRLRMELPIIWLMYQKGLIKR